MPHESARSGSNKALTVLAGVAVVFFIAAALYWARVIFVPVALAIYFAFILTPPVLWLQRRGLPRVPAVILVVATALVAFAATGLVIGRQVGHLAKTLPDHRDKIRHKAETVRDWIRSNEGGRLGDLVTEISDMFSGEAKPAEPVPGTPPAPPDAPQRVVIESAQPAWVSWAQGVLSPAAEVLGQTAFTFVLLLFMLNRREDLRNRMIRLMGQGRLTTTTKAVDDMSRRVSRFLLVQFLLNATFGVIITIGLLVIGVPYAPVWGFVGFLMRYVPYVGSWIAAIPPTLFTFAVSDTWGPPILVVVLFIGLELLAGNVAEPLLFGHSLGLSEVAQLVAAAFWAFLWGPVGLILSGPLTVCLLVLGKYVPQWRFLSILLGDEPVLSPRMAFYQRLAARDHDEAAEIVEKELGTRPAEEVFDDVLVPVLAVARRDAAEGRLSDDDVRFVIGSVREIAEEVAEFKSGEPVPGATPVRVLVVPAKDALDHAAAELFGRTLDPALWDVEVAPANVLTSELLETIAKVTPAVIVIAAMPPGGLTHTRYLCKRLRQRSADVKVVVGRWAAHEDDAHGSAQLREAGANEVTTSMEGTRTFLDGWRAVLAKDVEPAKPAEGRKPGPALVGTVSA
jgi:predicted PurR-regulated permease PerM